MSVDNKLVNYGGLKEQTKLTLERALLWDKGIMGGFAGDFPLSSARKGSVYRVPATNKWYVCTENYNGSQISTPNQQFTELSVFKNADRLDNLIQIKEITVPSSSFKKIATLHNENRVFVETKEPIFLDIQGTVLCLQVTNSNGYFEYVNLCSNKKSFLCGQLLHESFFPSDCKMTIRVAYIR